MKVTTVITKPIRAKRGFFLYFLLFTLPLLNQQVCINNMPKGLLPLSDSAFLNTGNAECTYFILFSSFTLISNRITCAFASAHTNSIRPSRSTFSLVVSVPRISVIGVGSA